MQLASRSLSALPVLLLAVAGVLLVTTLQWMLREPIQRTRDSQVTRWLDELLPAGVDNDPYQDIAYITAPDLLGAQRPLPIMRARSGDEVVALVMLAVAADGYSGPIVFATAVDAAGQGLGMRILGHRETDGYGAELHQSRSDWLRQSRGFAARDLALGDWRVKRDGGRFDAMSGATITSYAMIRGLKRTLVLAGQDFARLAQAPAAEPPDWYDLILALLRDV